MNEHKLRIVMKYCGLPPLVLIFMNQIAHRIQNRLCYAEFLPCYGVMEVEGVGEVGDVRGGRGVIENALHVNGSTGIF